MVIIELRVSSSTHCLLNGTSVDIKCVNFGFPRPEIIFFRGALQITPGQGSFSNFERVQNQFDIIWLTEAQRTDGGHYICEARDGSRLLSRSLPVDLVFCSKCQVDYPHQLLNVYRCTQATFLSSHMAWYEAYQRLDYSLLFSYTAHPTIVSLPAPDTNTERMRFELVCSFTGVPAPNIHWEKDGSVFILGDGRRINSSGRSALEITSLLVSDAGVYTCSVSNVAGMDSRSVQLEVRGKGVC